MSVQLLTGRTGSPITIALRCTPGSGAIWHSSAAPPGTTLECIEFVQTPDEGIGGLAEQVFSFIALMQGVYELRFELKRQWEPAIRDARTFRITIVD
jgi:hypothetical protein